MTRLAIFSRCVVVFAVVTSLVFFVSGVVLPKSTKPEGNEGVDIFINACRIQEDNSTMYYSASFECETSAFPYNDDFFKEKVLISGNFPERTLMRTERIYPRSSPYYSSADAGQATVILQRDGVDIGVTSVSWSPGAREAVLDTGLYAIPRVYSFGRIRGNHVETETAILAFEPKSDNYYDFSHESIDFFYQHVVGYKKNFGVLLYLYVRDENYDGRAVAKVVECRTKEGIVFQEYWIDPARGYVCPIVRIYNKESGKITEEYEASGFFQDVPSGLWFPARYTITKFDGADKVIQKDIYKIDPSSFRLNRKIADSEFSIDIPEGAIVSDRRNETSMIFYKAEQGGTLSFTKDGLTLGEMKWLDNITPLSPEAIEVLMQRKDKAEITVHL